MAADYLRRLRTEAQSFYGGLSQGRKVLLGAFLLGFLVVLASLVFWTQQAQWTTLYGELSARDAGQITQYLKEQDIPYRLQNAGLGTAIQVPEAQVHDVRLQMAAIDLPQEGGVMGYELFDKDNSMGMTNRVFDLNYQRALSGELARTIMQMDAVEKARVHLAIPRKQVFSALQDPPAASVTLRLRPLSQLTTPQIRGMSKLVSNSVPGLVEKNITITDSSGKLLFDGSMADDPTAEGELNPKQLAYQRNAEKEIRQNVERILTRVVGAGQVNVQVNARINFDQEQSVSKNYEPNANAQSADNTRVLRSEKEVVETGKGTEPVPAGAPGVTSNTPSYPAQTQTDASYNRRDTTRNYELPETQVTRVKEPGQIERISLSVALNSLSPAINAPEGLDANDPLIQNLRNLASAAAGLDTARGDSLAMYALPFENSDQKREQEALAKLDQQDLWVQIILGIVLALLLLGALIGFLFWRRKKTPLEGEPVEEDPLFAAYPSLEAPAMDPALTEAVHKRQQTVSSLTEMAEKEPAQMAQLLRVWLQEDA